MIGSAAFTFTTAGSGPFNIWSNSVSPTTPFVSDGSAEVGVKFQADLDGVISGIRFYKGSGNTGTHTGTLWSSTGTKLATATFTNETSTGWQSVTFTTPVAITAGTTYVASYHTAHGYASDSGYFSNAVDSVYLHALSDSNASGNGVYVYSSSTTFPTESYAATNYWVDVIYSPNISDTTPPTVISKTPAPDATGVTIISTVQAVFSEAIQSSSAVISVKDAANNPVPGSTSYNGNTKTATFTPTANLSPSTVYTVTVSGATDLAGNTMTATSWSFTTAAADTTPPALTSTTPNDGQTSVSVTAPILATFSEPVQSATIAVSVRDSGNNAVTGTTSYEAGTNTLTFTPSAPLAGSAVYTVTVSGAKDFSDNIMSPASWSFTTAEHHYDHLYVLERFRRALQQQRL